MNVPLSKLALFNVERGFVDDTYIMYICLEDKFI